MGIGDFESDFGLAGRQATSGGTEPVGSHCSHCTRERAPKSRARSPARKKEKNEERPRAGKKRQVARPLSAILSAHLVHDRYIDISQSK